MLQAVDSVQYVLIVRMAGGLHPAMADRWAGCAMGDACRTCSHSRHATDQKSTSLRRLLRPVPPPGQLVNSRLGYFIQRGKHAMIRADWEVFLDFADRQFAAAPR